MTINIFAAQNALPTSATGTTDLTHGTETDVPVAALHMFVDSAVNGTEANQAVIGIGMSDGVDDRYISNSSFHNVGASGQTYSLGSAACIASVFPDSTVLNGACGHNSFIAGGQRVNNDNGFSLAYLCSSMFFAGFDNAKVMTATLGNQDVDVNIDPGFAWKALIVMGACEGAGSGQGNNIYMGFFDKTNQGSLMANGVDAAMPVTRSQHMSTAYVGGQMGGGSGLIEYGIQAAVGAGTSCDLTPKIGDAGSDVVYCLFLGWSSSEVVSLFEWDSPSSAGSDVHTGMGFKPAAMINLLGFASAYNNAESLPGCGSYGFGFETASDQFCCSFQDEDGSSPSTDTQKITDNKSINLPEDDGHTGDVATLVSFDADGFERNYTNVEGTVNKNLSLAFSVAQATGETINRVLSESTVVTDPVPGYQLYQERPANSNVSLLTDAAFLYYAFARLVIENFDVQDQYLMEQNLRRELADTASVADAIRIIRTRFQETSDAIAASDDFNKTITIGEEGSIYTKVRSDVLTVTDAVDARFLGIVNGQVTDSVSVGEAAFLQRFRSYSLPDQIELLSDLINIARSYTRRTSDNAGAFDSVVATEFRIRSVTMFDSFALTDSFETQVTGIRRKRLTDMLNLTDARSNYQGSTLQPSVEIVTGLESH